MKYTVNDTTAYGIYNGISSADVREFARLKAKALELDWYDYDVDAIVSEINKNEDIALIASRNYIPYPVNEAWDAEYKTTYIAMIENKTAPGYANIADSIIENEVLKILQRIADKVVPAKKSALEAYEAEKQDIMSNIENVDTKVNSIRDEGGKTLQYIHVVTMKSGNVLTFSDRNIFDVGRVVNPMYRIDEWHDGGIAVSENGIMVWQCVADNGEWETVRPLTPDEQNALLVVIKYYGHFMSGIRM